MSKGIRKRGQLQAQVRALLEKNPGMKAKEISERLHISPANAYRALKRVKDSQTPPKFASSGSALDKLISAGEGDGPVTNLETRFMDMVRLIGFDRSLKLINTERSRLLKVLGV